MAYLISLYVSSKHSLPASHETETETDKTVGAYEDIGESIGGRADTPLHEMQAEAHILLPCKNKQHL